MDHENESERTSQRARSARFDTPLEPRYYPRVPFRVELRIEHEGASFRAHSLNVSGGGLAFATTESLEMGQEVHISFVLPVPGGEVAAIGRIVRIGRESELGREVAVLFTALADHEERALHALVAEHGDIAWEGEGGRVPRSVALHFIPLIRRIARGLSARLPQHVLVDDLIGAAFVALVEVWSRSPSASLEDFERAALPRLRYAMLDELRRDDPLTRRMRRKTRQLAEVRKQLETSLGRAPTRLELAGATGMTPMELDNVEAIAHVGSTHQLLEPDLVRDSADSPEDLVGRSESLERVRVALEALPPRHRKVLELHYGEHLTLREVGNILGVTESRISQLASEAVRRLRASHSMPGP